MFIPKIDKINKLNSEYLMTKSKNEIYKVYDDSVDFGLSDSEMEEFQPKIDSYFKAKLNPEKNDKQIISDISDDIIDKAVKNKIIEVLKKYEHLYESKEFIQFLENFKVGNAKYNVKNIYWNYICDYMKELKELSKNEIESFNELKNFKIIKVKNKMELSKIINKDMSKIRGMVYYLDIPNKIRYTIMHPHEN